MALALLAVAGCTGDGDRAGDGDRSTSTETSASLDADTVAFCEHARSLENAIQIDPQNPDPAEIGRTADALEALSVVAPREINGQVSSAGQLLREFADLLTSVDLSDPAAVGDPAFQERLDLLQERDSTLGSDLEEIVSFIDVECAPGTRPPASGQRNPGGEMDDTTS